MAWYRTGTVSVTNGSTTVTGSGTLWVANAVAGYGINLPDGRLYEIASVNSNTSITLGTAYLGSTASGQAYSIAPLRGPEVKLAQDIAALINDYGAAFLAAGQGKFTTGTISSPSVRNAADENTGLNLLGSDQLQLVTGGVARLLVTTSAATLNLPLGGTAVMQTDNDTTSGRLVPQQFAVHAARADYGNYYASGADVDAAPAGEVALYATSNAGTWPASPPSFLWVETQKLYISAMVQIAWRYTASGSPPASGPSSWYRTKSNDGTWGVWRAVYDTRSILGTVSQSSGVPTGAVIERGSNANGEYVRFADGTQICTSGFTASGVTVAAGSLYKSAPFTWTFPAAFSAGPAVAGAAAAADGRWLSYDGTPGTTSVSLIWMGAASVVGGTVGRATAIGRWF